MTKFRTMKQAKKENRKRLQQRLDEVIIKVRAYSIKTDLQEEFLELAEIVSSLSQQTRFRKPGK